MTVVSAISLLVLGVVMATHIPFISGDEACALVAAFYSDSPCVRIQLDGIAKFKPQLPAAIPIWIDPSVDGMDDVSTRKDRPWHKFMKQFPHFDTISTAGYCDNPVRSEVEQFVAAVLGLASSHSPQWISVPQLPMVNNTSRNKLNRELARAAALWKSSARYSGQLILPVIVTHQNQTNLKTARTPRVKAIADCFAKSSADGLWVVDKSLDDESGSQTLRTKRFPGLIAFHAELNAALSPAIKIAGPYWGLNQLLYAKGLIDYPAIGIGSGYQYYLAGGHASTPTAKLALPPLRRRAVVSSKLRAWLDHTVATLSPNHPAHAEFSAIRQSYSSLSATSRRQVAEFYKRWCDVVEGMTLPKQFNMFGDLAMAYALGKQLPEIDGEGTARRPEAIVDLLMNCVL